MRVAADILLIAVGISAILGHGVEAIAITVIVMFAVMLGFVQEYRAERAIAALRRLAVPTVRVLRDAAPIDVRAKAMAVAAQLRAQGETVVCVLPGHENEVQEFDCDRELASEQGRWVVRAL